MSTFRLLDLRKEFIGFLHEYINDPLCEVLDGVDHKPIKFIVPSSANLHLFERMEERKDENEGLGAIGTLLRELVSRRLCVLLHTLNKPERHGNITVSRGRTHLKMGIIDNEDNYLIVIRTYVNTNNAQHADYNEVILVD